MPTITAPGPMTTISGAPLPLVALPQTELLTVNESALPLIENVLGEGIHVKVLRLDLEHNEQVVLLVLAPGAALPLHYHTGPAEVYTLQGRWLYREFPDQPQTAGSYIYEPGGTAHTLVAPEDNTEDTVLLARVTGALANFNEDGSLHSLLDALMARHLTDTACAERGLETPRYIGGGESSYSVDAR